MKPHDMGVLFDECAQNGSDMRVHLDRPFDLASDAGTEYGVDDLAALVGETAGWLAAAGAAPGARVAIVKDDRWDYGLLACAAVVLKWSDAPRTGTGKGRRRELLKQLAGHQVKTHGSGRWT
ncbi:hypothetical protein [Saccharothrix deserti]|uniref:hypothetical protein n=1 Tax=Saccharothrix deserti TaxID=2593674 RepID=UPI00192E38EC|nr:hypothetical protein [Saccharothrix deserti]